MNEILHAVNQFLLNFTGYGIVICFYAFITYYVVKAALYLLFKACLCLKADWDAWRTFRNNGKSK